MPLTDVEAVNMLVGNTPDNIFYPMLEEEEVEYLLQFKGGNIIEAAKMAASAISFKLATTNNKERVGDTEIWNDAGKNYRLALQEFLKETKNTLPNGVMPWAAGISKSEMLANMNNPDVNQSPLVRLPKTCSKSWLQLEYGGCWL